uniref:Putative ovule protein n=1 Tax=Solanum chacoense TaxID=4108 RepID=A0A0V0H2X3_SOLCH
MSIKISPDSILCRIFEGKSQDTFIVTFSNIQFNNHFSILSSLPVELRKKKSLLCISVCLYIP